MVVLSCLENTNTANRITDRGRDMVSLCGYGKWRLVTLVVKVAMGMFFTDFIANTQADDFPSRY